MPAPVTGQLALTSVAQPLVGFPVTGAGFTIKAASANAAAAYIGPAGVSTSTGFYLAPGDSIDYERTDANGRPRYQLNVSDFYGVGTAGDKISWLVSQ